MQNIEYAVVFGCIREVPGSKIFPRSPWIFGSWIQQNIEYSAIFGYIREEALRYEISKKIP